MDHLFNLWDAGLPDHYTDEQVEALARYSLTIYGYELGIQIIERTVRDGQRAGVEEWVPQHGPSASLTMSR